MTVRPAILLARLAHLSQVLAQLARLRAMSPEERMSDAFFLMVAERGLHVAAEAIFDLGHHILAGRGLIVPATYREVIPALVNTGVLPEPLGQRLSGMAGLRNILVHDYAEIDSAQVWLVLDEHWEDLRSVQQHLSQIAELLQPIA